jgi:hypothetical protein
MLSQEGQAGRSVVVLLDGALLKPLAALRSLTEVPLVVEAVVAEVVGTRGDHAC